MSLPTVLLRKFTMRHFLLTVVLAASPLWGEAGPANDPAALTGGAGGAVMPEAPGGDQGKDQRRAALRQALLQRKDTAAAPADGQAGRQLSPAERAELRRQLRDQSSR